MQWMTITSCVPCYAPHVQQHVAVSLFGPLNQIECQVRSGDQNEVDPTCQMCSSHPETLDHFLLECPMLSAIRKPVLCDISNEYNNLNCSPSHFHSLCKEEHLKIILDCSYLTNSLRNNKQSEKLLLQL